MTEKSAQPVMICRDLAVGYGTRAVLSGIDLAFQRGQFVSLLGPNGAGKTTLLRTLSRHLPPVRGRVDLKGRPLAGLSALELARTMAVVLTDKVSPPLFTVFEFVALGRYPHTDFLGRLRPEDRRAVDEALDAVHAKGLAHRTFSDLSDGERQKILVARALAQRPDILLLDEPTLHLDLKHRVEVMAILRELCRAQGITVAASLHDVDVAAKVSDRVALIKNGGVSAYGPPEAVLTGGAVADLYDFQGAVFDRGLGGIELRGNGRRGRAFVAAGMGSGAMIYRLLAKRGFSLATGVIHTNDLDYYVARSLGADCAARSPMAVIDEAAAAEAATRLADCDVVIDCGFEIGAVNKGNAALLRAALASGKPVFSLRPDDNGLFDGAPADSIVRCADVAGLLDALDRAFPMDGVPDIRTGPLKEAS